MFLVWPDKSFFMLSNTIRSTNKLLLHNSRLRNITMVNNSDNILWSYSWSLKLSFQFVYLAENNPV